MTYGLSQEERVLSATDACYIGVDGGGSKTLAIVVDARGRERGRGLAGSANYASVGLARAVEQVHLAATRALQAAGCQHQPRGAWIGLAGMDRRVDLESVYPHVRTLAEHVHLTNDAELPLAALDQAIGVTLIAGTGSIALGRDMHGRTHRVGGWGHILGDEGSGYEIGRLALQAATRAADGRGPQTTLLPRILQHWELQRPEDLISAIYPERDTARIARVATCVFAAARDGDPVARTIVRHAAEELALAVLVVSNALDFPDGILPLALGGSLLVREAPFRAQILRRLRARRQLGQVVIVEEPALSAAQAAMGLDQIYSGH